MKRALETEKNQPIKKLKICPIQQQINEIEKERKNLLYLSKNIIVSSKWIMKYMIIREYIDIEMKDVLFYIMKLSLIELPTRTIQLKISYQITKSMSRCEKIYTTIDKPIGNIIKEIFTTTPVNKYGYTMENTFCVDIYNYMESSIVNGNVHNNLNYNENILYSCFVEKPENFTLSKEIRQNAINNMKKENIMFKERILTEICDITLIRRKLDETKPIHFILLKKKFGK